MNKIKTILENNVANIAIVLGIIGILSHIGKLMFGSKIWVWFQVISFSDPFMFISQMLNNSFTPHILSILFLFMLFVGGIHYKLSKGKDARLLKFCLSIMSIKYILGLGMTLINFYHFKYSSFGNMHAGNISTIDFIYYFIYLIPFAYVSTYLILWLAKKTSAEFQIIPDPTNTVYEYEVVSKSKRFVHLIFDLFIMSLTIWPVLIYQLQISAKTFSGLYYSLGSNFNNLFQNIVLLLGITLYYIFFEGLFSSTPIKFLTATTVVDKETLRPPTFGKIITRSLSRRIPFDSISYVGEEGWHDSISKTTVIHEKRDGHVGFSHMIWPFLLIGIYIAIYAFQLSAKNKVTATNKEVRAQAKTYERESIINNLSKGDLLLFNNPKGSYSSDKPTLVIEEITEDQITGTYYLAKYNDRKRPRYLNYGITENWIKQGEVTLNKTQVIEAYFTKSKKEPIAIDTISCILDEILDIDNPLLDSRQSSSNYSSQDDIINRTHTIHYDVCNTINLLSVEVLEGTTDWTLGSVKSNNNSARGRFELKSTSNKKNKKLTKARLKLTCNGRLLSYIIFNYDSKLFLIMEYED